MPERSAADLKKARLLAGGSSLDTKDTRSDAETLVARCTELEGALAELQAKYDQYFLGIERRPPTDTHDRLKREITAMRQTTVKQTAAKFRTQSLYNKLLTYERLWQRTLQEIEAGTYKRHLFKARLHHKEEKPEPVKAPEAAKAAEAPAKPAAAPVAKAAAPAAPAPGGLSEAKMKAIFDAYVMAKKRCNEDTSKLSYESVAQTLKAQVPTLMKQHNAKSVEFKVVIKDGRAVLRALPKDS